MKSVRSIATLYPGHRCRFKSIRPVWHWRPIDRFVSPVRFRRKKKVLRNNLPFFRSLDALVAPERHCMMLRTKLGVENLRLIHARHGAGDREAGFDDRCGAFDFTLLQGQKLVDRMKDLAYLRPGSHAVVGYPKFEVVRGLKRKSRRFFANDNPVMVYNPHFDQSVSSWTAMGLEVLDFFAANPDYNLIFAPHVVLFKRHKRHNGYLPRKYRRVRNIFIDTGSSASADMTYMLNADIYLGDVSSQVYEFLLEPRPCIFLNGHHVEWKGDVNYYHFTLGQVVDDVGTEMRPALENAFSMHGRFLDEQRRAFAYTFHTQSNSTAAERGADAIARFLLEPGQGSAGAE